MTTSEDELKKADFDFGPANMKTLVEQMRQDLSAYKEYIKIQSELIWFRFNELIGQGFSQEQALHLCKYGLENPGVQ